MEKSVIIVPVGEYLDNLFVSLKEFPAEKVILITTPSTFKKAKRAKEDLENVKIPAQMITLQGKNVWEELFIKISKIKEVEKGKQIIINTGMADKHLSCAATCAAFVNGLKALSVEGGEVMLLPVLKFSYYKILSERKLKLLKILNKNNGLTLNELATKANVSLPLASYHVYGNLKSEGLQELGLVETSEIATRNLPASARSKRAISECAQEHAPGFSPAVLDIEKNRGTNIMRISTLGKLLFKGYISAEEKA